MASLTFCWLYFGTQIDSYCSGNWTQGNPSYNQKTLKNKSMLFVLRSFFQSSCVCWSLYPAAVVSGEHHCYSSRWHQTCSWFSEAGSLRKGVRKIKTRRNIFCPMLPALHDTMSGHDGGAGLSPGAGVRAAHLQAAWCYLALSGAQVP